jgi:hypothetical protein
MTTRLLAGAAAIVLMSGAAFAQAYPPAPPPPVGPPPVAVAPGISPGTSTTTTVAPGPDGGYRASTTRQGVDVNGNPVTEKNTYKEGIEGSTQTHTKTTTDPFGAGTTTTRSTTKTAPQ